MIIYKIVQHYRTFCSVPDRTGPNIVVVVATVVAVAVAVVKTYAAAAVAFVAAVGT